MVSGIAPREPTTHLKSLPLLALVALFSLSSCDKARTLLGPLGKKPAASAAASPTGATASDIPAAVRELLPAEPGRIVMVDFYADWCGPCRMLSPILEKIAGENPRTVQVCKVNVDKFRELSSQQGVSGIPDVRIFVDGKLAAKFVGALPEAEVRKRIDDLVRQLPAAAPPKETDAAKAKPKEPAIRPMTKDWMPPGIQRR